MNVLINNWEDLYLPILLYQQRPDIYNNIEKKIYNLIKKNQFIIITDLLYFIKDIINNLFEMYGLKSILEGINEIIEYIIDGNYTKYNYDFDKTDYQNATKYFNIKNKKIIYNELNK
jgi:hypothetical protein